MKKILFLLLGLIGLSTHAFAKSEMDSLLYVLDRTIEKRQQYITLKEEKINNLKTELLKQYDLDNQYKINKSIINEYSSFKCDSALTYIYKNIDIARSLNTAHYIDESQLQLSFVLSLAGLFTQALESLNQVHVERLHNDVLYMYYWTYIRYYENLIKYTENPEFGKVYIIQKDSIRNTLISILSKDSEEYIKEEAFSLQEAGKLQEACNILLPIYHKQQLSTHAYAMSAMGLAKIYAQMGDKNKEEKYLAMAAITDIQLAVKENEALLSLALLLYDKGDVDRAYNYIKVAMDDANFYNSRFRNTVIARVQPIIEETYLLRIGQQKKNLRNYSILSSVFVVILIITLTFIYKQIKIVSKARKNLKIANLNLAKANQNLDEANLIKEKYIGYFMNQCSIYIDKLDDYRKNVNRKIKVGQIDDLLKLTSSTFNLQKDIEELYETFDKAFFKLYPDFVEQFNALLKEQERYRLDKGRLNTELRIFALIRLGITDVNTIAGFLRYSIQTIYNYKSKVKGKSIIESDNFEDEVKKISTFS